MSRKSLFEYFELYIPHYSMFNYLVEIKTDLIFVELLNFNFHLVQNNWWENAFFWLCLNLNRFTSGIIGLTWRN